MKKRILTLLFLAISIAANAQYTTLYDFPGGLEGMNPWADLLSDGTYLYGTTSGGGTGGMGTIFKVKPDGTGYTKLHDFTGTTDGKQPRSSLISDGVYLYGTTLQGGSSDMGVIYKIKPDGTGFLKLLDFAGASNGNLPHGSLLLDSIYLYGMTVQGGANDLGVVYKIKKDGSGYVNLMDFAGASNGSNPYGALISDGTHLYGMTYYGGLNGMGVVFKLKPDGTGYSTLLDFDGTFNGSNPIGSLISDGSFLYGMTTTGGVNNYGALFKIRPDGTGYYSMVNFDNVSGDQPNGSLLLTGGYLYGMTRLGGMNSLGIIFKVLTDGSGFAKLHDFEGSTGKEPFGSLITDGTYLYGMTFQGGTGGFGVIFKYGLVTGATETLSADNAIVLYPNPMSANAVVHSEKLLRNATLTLHDCRGQLVMQIADLQGHDISISRERLPAGLYSLRLTGGGAVIGTAKLVVTD